MSDLWFPGADRSRPAPNDGGSLILDYPPRCVWHDTETNGIPSYSTGSFPQITIYKGTAYQHIAADRAARALRHPSGTIQTNRANCFQIECVGWVNQVAFHPIMREIAEWLEDVRGIPRKATSEWRPYPESYGANGVRFSDAKWRDFSGHCAHMHVPHNDHGDTGWPFPIELILGGDMLTVDDKTFLTGLRDGGVRMTATGDPDVIANKETNNIKNVLGRIDQLEAAIGSVVTVVPQIDYDLLADKVVERLHALSFRAE